MRIRTFAMLNKDMDFEVGDTIYYSIAKDKLGYIIDDGYAEILDLRKMPNRKRNGVSHQLLIKTAIAVEPQWIGSCWCWKTQADHTKAHVSEY